MRTHRSSRSRRRQALRRIRDRWVRFLADKNRSSWRPYDTMSRDGWLRLVTGLASGRISWRGSDRWWKHHLRRSRKRHEADVLRLEHDQASAELDNRSDP